MWLGQVTHLGTLVMEPATLATALVSAMGMAFRQRRRLQGERLRATRVQEELMAYLLLDDWQTGDARAMGRRICRTIGRHSAFGASALLVPDHEGRLRVMASTRTDDLTVRALERWADAQQAREQHAQESAASLDGAPDDGEARDQRLARRSRMVRLERRSGYEPGDPAALAWCTALIVPMATERGEVTGAIAVCADRINARPAEVIEAALRPLELLAARFAARAAGLRLREFADRPERLAGLQGTKPPGVVVVLPGSRDGRSGGAGRQDGDTGADQTPAAELLAGQEARQPMRVH